jgi:hypothetical protein
MVTKDDENKNLPPFLEVLTDRDREKFISAMEVDPNSKSPTYGTSAMCVQSVVITNQEGQSSPFNLKDLYTLPLRKLAKNIGVANCGSKNKYDCRRAIAAYFEYHRTLTIHGLAPTSHHGRQTSTLIRAINVVFSSQFIEGLKTCNDSKSRRDHETNNTNKKFWITAAMAHNCIGGNENVLENDGVPTADDIAAPTTDPATADASVPATAAAATGNENDDDEEGEMLFGTDSFSELVIQDETDVHLRELKEDPEINLRSVNQFDTGAFRKKITDLFCIRRIMKDNMTVSGTHDSDPWNFVQSAVTKSKKYGLPLLAVYYFYIRCNEHPDLDAKFQPFLDSGLIGDTVRLDQDDPDEDTEDVDSDDSMGSSGSSRAGLTGKYIGRDRNKKKRSNPVAAGRKTSGESSSSSSPSGMEEEDRSSTGGRTPSGSSVAAASTVSHSSKKTKKGDKKTKDPQQLMIAMLTHSQNDFREFVKKQAAVSTKLIQEAERGVARAIERNERERLQSVRENLRLRLEIAKAMGDIEEMKKVMTLSSKLLGSGDKHMYRDENDGDNDSSGEDNYH